MNTKETHEGTDAVASVEPDISSLPRPLQELLPTLDPAQRHVLLQYIEVHNHMGEYPLHVIVRDLDALSPGFGKESLAESLKDTRDERRRLNWSTAAEIFSKLGGQFAGWGLAIFGAWKGIGVLSQPDPTGMEVIAGFVVLVACIGGPVGIAVLMRNSGVRIGVQTRLEDE